MLTDQGIARSERHHWHEWVLGPRFIDLPIRVVALIDLVSSVFPDTMESTDPLYLFFHFAAPLLAVVATYFPLAAGLTAAGLFCLHLNVSPEDLDAFQGTMVFCVAVLLTHLRWRSAIAITALAFGSSWLAMFVHAPVGFASSYGLVFYDWLRSAVLALTAAAVEVRFRRTIRQREEAARAHEREIRSQRLRFAADTHDTVSQGLARQSRMIALLANENLTEEKNTLLSELSFTNDETQEQIRNYLSQLHDVDHPHSGRPPHSRIRGLQTLRESLQRAAEAGGLRLTVRQEIPPEAVTDQSFEVLRLVARELTTNMIKHAAPGSECALDLAFDRPTNMFRFSSANPVRSSASPGVETPRSLAARARDLGGTCTVGVREDIYRIEVTIPR